MKSPFPGMDPYIEALNLWKDFHDDLISELKRAISAALPDHYVVRTGQRSYVVLAEAEEKTERHFEPDVTVRAGRGARSRGGPATSGGTAVAPEEDFDTLRAFIEEEFDESFIDIYHLAPDRRLVTSVEVLSPSNKRRGSKGWELYLRKRQALLRGRANLVEIDLLRGGDRMPMLDPLPTSPYYVLIGRREKAPYCRVGRASFDRPLPAVPVPLAKPDADIPVALQPMVDAVYARSRYDDDIDYSQPLQPPLPPEQVAWLAGRLRGESAAPARRSRRRK
ncbi:MAG TPA: DUF4058 family protein [Gemmataceae bacterium]|nr:DUF4058 family protein [Gemmataceae bacterium]